MKKVIIFLVIIIALFAGMGFLNYLQNKDKLGEDNPYGTNNLSQETIDQLDDPNYQNIILPEELETKLNNKEDVTVYFYASDCPHCKRTTPVLMPLAEEMGVDIAQYNLKEFVDGWDQYAISGTPTLVHFKDGKEVARIDGEREEAVFKQWIEENVK
jgi:thiol-disulfide isomerase/thioredoxin